MRSDQYAPLDIKMATDRVICEGRQGILFFPRMRYLATGKCQIAEHSAFGLGEKAAPTIRPPRRSGHAKDHEFFNNVLHQVPLALRSGWSKRAQSTTRITLQIIVLALEQFAADTAVVCAVAELDRMPTHFCPAS
jgi:hypothetical protein